MDEQLKRLRRMGIFAAVAREGSFTRAARILKLGKSIVSEHISLLEEDLGTRLLQRTTRRLNLTEAGQLYLSHCREMLDAAQRAEAALQLHRGQVTGTLRVTTTVDFGLSWLSRWVGTYHQLYPEVRVEMILEDSVIDLVRHGIDLSLRIGWPPDSDMVARKLGESKTWLVASPDWVAAHQGLERPTQLVGVNWIDISVLPKPATLLLRQQDGSLITLKFDPSFSSNSPEGAKALALQGLGVCAIQDFAVARDVAAGNLIRLFPQYEMGGFGIFAIYPVRDYLPLKVSTFIEHISGSFHGGELVVRE